MSKSIVAAEKAAINGDGAEYDTQYCLHVLKDVLTDSPHRSSTPVRDNASVINDDHSRPPRSSPPPSPKKILEGQTIVKFIRGENGKLRAFDEEGNQIDPIALRKMDNLTQRSTMSATQEFPESAYERFDLLKSRKTMYHTEDHSDDDNEPDNKEGGGHTVTESTVHTWGENDTGHVRFDSYTATKGNEHTIVSSTDDSHIYEPRTPAPAINPFAHKGSVLKAHEMFGATQPSSIGRLASAASTRPSPNYGNSSPTKVMPSSPLQVHSRSKSDESPSPTPVTAYSMKSSSVPIFERSKSVDAGPRQYVSMRESQEARRKEKVQVGDESDANSDTDSESDMNDVPRKLKEREREARILKEISVVTQKRPVPRQNSTDTSGVNVEVEVPSTESKARRRSIQEEYITQCSGFDARGTQSQSQSPERVADSQSLETELPTYSAAQTRILSPGVPSTSAQPSDPAIILETSPSDRIRPMGEVASLSFDVPDEIDAPGFTQDVDFENALRPFSSPSSGPSKPSRLRNRNGEADLNTKLVSNQGPAKMSTTAKTTAVITGSTVGSHELPNASVQQKQGLDENAQVATEKVVGDDQVRETAVTQSNNAIELPEVFADTPENIQKSKIASSSTNFTPLSSLASTISSISTTSAPSKTPAKKNIKRKRTATDHVAPAPTRSSKRKSIICNARDSSTDPLAGPSTGNENHDQAAGLFENMAFAVSYVKQEKEKDSVIRLINDNGGRVLEAGFNVLFDPVTSHDIEDTDEALTLSSTAKTLGFVALIADEYSRRAKYMEALALGLPCISGHWIRCCVQRGEIVGWDEYLLCAGVSSFIGGTRSRILQPYSASQAKFVNTYSERRKMLAGMSILLVTGKGRVAEEKKAFVFLTQVLGPAHIEQVAEFQQARKRLVEYEERRQKWDMVYVYDQKAANTAIFSSTSAKSRKRKGGPIEEAAPAPKRVRMISDEDVVQSLIFGRLIDE